MSGWCHVGSPSSVTVPCDGGRNPAIMCSTVVLPAPFGPSRPVTPGPSAIVTSLTATTLPYHRDTAARSIALIGCLPVWRLRGSQAHSSRSYGCPLVWRLRGSQAHSSRSYGCPLVWRLRGSQAHSSRSYGNPPIPQQQPTRGKDGQRDGQDEVHRPVVADVNAGDAVRPLLEALENAWRAEQT